MSPKRSRYSFRVESERNHRPVGTEEIFSIVQLSGGLGNQMFQYAFSKAVSLKSRTKTFLDDRFFSSRLQNPFGARRQLNLGSFEGVKIEQTLPEWVDRPSVTRLKLLDRGVPDRLLGVFDGFSGKLVSERTPGYFPELIDTQADLTYYRGYWQSFKYFADFRDVLRVEFRPHFAEGSETAIMKQLIESEATVGIHVRRGDYASKKANRNYFGLLPDRYFLDALMTIENFFSATQVAVFTDDVEWCNHFIRPRLPTIYIGRSPAKRNDAEDMFLLSLCKAIVSSNSSFSWWASWLSEAEENRVVVPEKWFPGVDSDWNHLLLPGWTRLSSSR